MRMRLNGIGAVSLFLLGIFSGLCGVGSVRFCVEAQAFCVMGAISSWVVYLCLGWDRDSAT